MVFDYYYTLFSWILAHSVCGSCDWIRPFFNPCFQRMTVFCQVPKEAWSSVWFSPFSINRFRLKTDSDRLCDEQSTNVRKLILCSSFLRIVLSHTKPINYYIPLLFRVESAIRSARLNHTFVVSTDLEAYPVWKIVKAAVYW